MNIDNNIHSEEETKSEMTEACHGSSMKLKHRKDIRVVIINATDCSSERSLSDSDSEHEHGNETDVESPSPLLKSQQHKST